MTPSLHLCVAIPTWNRSQLLRGALDSLTQVRDPRGASWGVTVVDNNCTDDTEEVVAAFEGRLPNLRLIREPAPGSSHARNRAVAESKADHLLFLDDDSRVEAGWLEAFVRAVRRHPEAAAFGGPVVPHFPEPPAPELLEAFSSVRAGFCAVDHRRPLGPLPSECELMGANMAFRCGALAGLRFDPSLGVSPSLLGSGEEEELIRLLRARGEPVVWVPEMRVRHVVDPSRLQLDYLIRLAHDRGRSHIRRFGVPSGPRVAGVPVRLWWYYARERVRAALAVFGGDPIRSAGRRAKCERYRGRIAECRAQQAG